MTTRLTRRGLFRSTSAAALGSLLPWDLAQAQAQAPGGTLRVGMTASAIPLSNGCPDQGAEGHRFMGITLYDQLVEWDLSSFDKPAVLTPGLATAWHVDPANPKRWIFTLREGVTFHDGKPLTAEDVVFSYDRATDTRTLATDANGNDSSSFEKVEHLSSLPSSSTLRVVSREPSVRPSTNRVPETLAGFVNSGFIRRARTRFGSTFKTPVFVFI